MKRITANDIEKFHNLYSNGDYNSYNAVWSQLIEASEWIELHDSLILEETETAKQKLIENKEQLFSWVQLTFPDIYSELMKGKSSVLNDAEDFPKFKPQKIAFESLHAHLDFKIIKKLIIWGQEIKLKQTFQRIENLELGNVSNTIKFKLSNNAYLLIVNRGTIVNSGFSLTFKDAFFIELEYNRIRHSFEQETENKVKTQESTVDVSSIYLNALEIQK